MVKPWAGGRNLMSLVAIRKRLVSESQGMKYNGGVMWQSFVNVKEKSGWMCTSCSEHSEHSQEGVALVQLEDYTNVSLVGKSKTDLGSPFRNDLSPVASNGFHIDTGLQPGVIIPLSSTNSDKGGLFVGLVHILCLHLISLDPSAAFLWWPSPSCKGNQSNSIGHAKWCKRKQLKGLISACR